MDRLACVNVAALPLQLLLRAHPDWRSVPAAVIDTDKPQGLILHVNASARKKGVRTGQRYATALSIARDLRAGTVPRTQIDRNVSTMTDRLRRFSPHVEPSSDRPGIFWLDAQGLGRLYPSMQVWAEEVRADLLSVSLTATIAVSFSRFGSFALAISGPAEAGHDVRICDDPADEHARVERVPLACIGLDTDARDRLLALGITTVAEFLRLPAGGIRARFGAPTDALYRLAAGTRFSPLVPAPLEEPHTCSVDIDFPEHTIERLIFVVKRMLDQLTSSIERQVRTVAGLVLRMTLDNREQRTERVRPAAPTLDVAQLLTLIRLRLDSLQLPAGIVSLAMTADTCAAGARQRTLFATQARRETEDANQALARLRAEYGEQSVVRARLCDAHLPGARFAWEPLEAVPPRSAPRVVAARPLVRRIFEKPVPLTGPAKAGHYVPSQSYVVSAFSRTGYVLSGGWWGPHPVEREYFFFRADNGDLQWIYFDRRRQRLFLQGHVE